jgi:nucleoside-diphosphate-sugar epimerase
VYGESKTLPKKETMNTIPISPYGVSKLAAENYCRVFAKVYELHTISLRYFNVYGPRQKYGFYSGVIPTFIQQVARNEPPTIYGDGQQSRDFTYVEDVVQANLLSLEKEVAKGEVFNIAAGRPITVNRLAALTIELKEKKNLSPVHLQPRTGDIRYSYADISKAKRFLGYSPNFTIEDGLPRVIAWMQKK